MKEIRHTEETKEGRVQLGIGIGVRIFGRFFGIEPNLEIRESSLRRDSRGPGGGISHREHESFPFSAPHFRSTGEPRIGSVVYGSRNRTARTEILPGTSRGTVSALVEEPYGPGSRAAITIRGNEAAVAVTGNTEGVVIDRTGAQGSLHITINRDNS